MYKSNKCLTKLIRKVQLPLKKGFDLFFMSYLSLIVEVFVIFCATCEAAE